MEKNNLIRFVESIVFLPVLAVSLSFSGIQSTANPKSVLTPKINIESDGTLAFNQAITTEDLALDSKTAEAQAIDAYFAVHDMPLVGTGAKMVEAAEANELDWRLLPAIAVRESTGGKNACKKVENNPFGWNSCKVGFDSIDDAIDTVAKNLGGNNPKTAVHYDNKSVKEILQAYNPPYVVPKYAEQVMSIMNNIGSTNVLAIKTGNINT